MTRTSPEPIVPPQLPPHVVMIKNRLGRPYYYLQRHRGTARAEKRQRLPDDPRSDEFWRAYARLTGASPEPAPTRSFAALIDEWQDSAEWRQMAPKTRVEWARYCRHIRAAWGSLEVAGVEPYHVLRLRDTMADRPAAANNLLRCLSVMLAWSVPRRWRADNPCREIKLLRTGDGYAPWTWDAIEASRGDLLARRPDLWWAAGVSLYTGQRQGDALAMRWDDIANGMLAVRQQKTAKRLAIPLHRDLQALLETIPRRAPTILTSSEGRPWTRDGFRSAWGKHRPAAAAGLVFHGLRKSAVVFLLEAGCTDAEVAAITGQTREMVEHYARQVNQHKLAAAAVLKWEAAGSGTDGHLANTVANTTAQN